MRQRFENYFEQFPWAMRTNRFIINRYTVNPLTIVPDFSIGVGFSTLSMATTISPFSLVLPTIKLRQSTKGCPGKEKYGYGEGETMGKPVG
jgi:hypothetical protein